MASKKNTAQKTPLAILKQLRDEAYKNADLNGGGTLDDEEWELDQARLVVMANMPAQSPADRQILRSIASEILDLGRHGSGMPYAVNNAIAALRYA